MTIEFHCPHCQKYLKTADDKAGLRANCPGCSEVIDVPFESQASASPHLEEAAEDYGEPAGEPTGGPPPLPPPGKMKPCPMCGEQIKAAALKCRYCGEELEPTAGARERSSHLAPHRGNLILIFGILSFAICCFFGIAAWVMGNQDLNEMAAGRMDPEGEGLTKAGKIIGMVHVFLVIGVFFLYMCIIGVAIVAQN